jgi:hypothetical protein
MVDECTTGTLRVDQRNDIAEWASPRLQIPGSREISLIRPDGYLSVWSLSHPTPGLLVKLIFRDQSARGLALAGNERVFHIDANWD